MIYLDSSALMKLVREEAETEALRDWLASQPEVPVVTSELARAEVLRAARRAGSDALTEAHAVIGDVDLVPLDRGVQDIACEIGDPPLRTLDALHLASAALLGDDLTAFAAYDHRLLTAAQAAGLPTMTPYPSEPADEPEPVPVRRLDRDSQQRGIDGAGRERAGRNSLDLSAPHADRLS